MHLTEFGIKNFTVFKKFQHFDFAPISLLTGPNSSGKSSLIKALLLLKDSIPDRTDYKSIEYLSDNLESPNNIFNNIPFKLHFNHCLIIDNYLFSSEYTDYNLLPILTQIDLATRIKYNLLILTYGDNNKHDAVTIMNYLLDYKKKNNLKFNPSVIVLKKPIEHDRNIFMNYMRIKSGNSLNYVNTQNRVIVNTELTFIPYTTEENFCNADIILKDIAPDIREIIDSGEPMEIQGNGDFRLFE